MRWERRGLLVAPPVGLQWAASHAALPVTEPLGGGRVRVYYSSRDTQGRSQIGRADVDLGDDADPVHASEPLVRHGRDGEFDADGVTTSCIVADGGRLNLYYTGWRLAPDAPFHLAVGCAVSSDGGHRFERAAPGPVLSTSPADPILTASPAVLIDGGRWRMWYVSGSGWRDKAGRTEPEYNIRYAESADGIEWRPSGRVCINYSGPAEHAIARPCVIRDGTLYRMWFCSRGHSYRIGYAESDDGLEWRRADPGSGLEPAAAGWDSEMMAYPWVFDHGGERLMVYNGNGYGRSGIGLAAAISN
ncbi:MAG: hypothetical protein NVS9B1_21790 [Candidatus Dormibacteraceae bacterium]